ncbi:MAG: 50S ribosomal protein L10 [Firmicutes bacterium]|nr:50S ribosomal protein L10 [Bacillota bacterium]
MVTRSEKERTLVELEDKFRRAQSAVLADFQGLTVAEMSRLRRMAREAGVEFEVVKNTLAALATRRAGIEGLDVLFSGPTAVAFGYDDPVSPAKVIDRFSRERREVPFKGGYLPGRVLGPGEVRKLAALPGRQELLGMVVGTLQAPIAGLQRVLAGNLRGLAVVLSRISEKRPAAG